MKSIFTCKCNVITKIESNDKLLFFTLLRSLYTHTRIVLYVNEIAQKKWVNSLNEAVTAKSSVCRRSCLTKLACELIDRFTNRLTNQRIDRLTSQLTNLLINRFINRLTDRLTDQLIDRHTNQLTE